MSKILITTSSFDLEAPEIKALQAAGYEPVLNPHKRRLSEEEVAELLTPEIVGMIAGVEPLTKSVINGAQNLRAIARCGIGMDSVDIAAAKAKGIAVTNTPDAPTKAVAELTVGLMLDVLRAVPLQDRAIRDGKWVRPMGGLLSARTVGLIGYGRIGKKTAEYVRGFGAKVIACDNYVQDPALVSFDTVLVKADIISLHIPYSNEVRHIIDAAALAKMKKGSYLINASRGGLVDEAALAGALESGHLGGAALDVYENEPYTGALTQFDNIVLSAHVGSYASEARKEQEALAAANLLASLEAIQEQEVAHG